MKTFISNPGRGVAVLSLCLAGWLGVFAPAAFAQAPAATAPGEAPAPVFKVGTLTIRFVGTANVNEQVVRANMEVREGSDIDQAMLDRDIKQLYKTGLFEFIEIKQEPVGTNILNLVIDVTPKFRVFAVHFEGNKRVKTTRLLKEVKTRANQALDERQVKDDSEKLREYYQKSGYNQVSISYSIERDRVGGFGTVTFKVKEGDKVKIAEVRFSGNAHIKAKALKGEMDTKKWWIFSWLTGSGRFKDDEFDDDLDKLRDYYREHGYLDVEIPQDQVVFSYPNPTHLVLVITVIEGPQYHVGDISFTGNKLYSSNLLKRVVRQHPGAVFAPLEIGQGRGAAGRLLRQGRLPGHGRPPRAQAEPRDGEYRYRVSDYRSGKI